MKEALLKEKELEEQEKARKLAESEEVTKKGTSKEPRKIKRVVKKKSKSKDE